VADRYLLESSSTDGYLLEDGSGVLLLQFSTFTSAITESATATDSSSVSLVTLSAITETVSSTESTSSTQVTLSAITESGSATESQSNNFVTLPSIQESGTATESNNALSVYVAAIIEAANATENETSSQLFINSITEIGTATELANSTQDLFPIISETVSSTESSSVTQILPTSLAESVTATEVSESLKTLEALISEQGSASDLNDSSEEDIAGITESAEALDIVQAVGIYGTGIIESGNATETTDAGSGMILTADVEEIALAEETTTGTSVYIEPVVVDSTVWIKFGKFSIMPCDPCAPKFIVSCLTDEPTDDFEFNIYGLADGVYYWRITEASTVLTKAFSHVEGTPLSIAVSDVPDGFFQTKRTFLFEILKTASSENPIPFLIGQYVEQLSIDIECNIYPSQTVGEDTTP